MSDPFYEGGCDRGTLQQMAKSCRGGGGAMDVSLGDTEDPDQVISFLCLKFSGLIDRVQVAESRQAGAQQLAAALGPQLRGAVERCKTSAAGLHTALKLQRSEVEHARRRLKDTKSSAAFASGELQRARDVVATLEEQCEALRSRCNTERQCALDAADVVAHDHEALQACDHERARLRSEVNKASSQIMSFEEEIAMSRERERNRRADVRALEDRVGDAGRAKKTTVRRAGVQHEELCGAVRKVALYRERLEVARHTLHRLEEELRREDEHMAVLRSDKQNREQEAAAMGQGLAQLQQTNVSLEVALRENVELRDGLKAVAQLRQATHQRTAAVGVKQQEVQAELTSFVDRLTAGETDVSRWRQRLQVQRESVQQTRSTLDMLERDSRGPAGCTSCSNLQGELQKIFAETESLRSSCSEATNGNMELQRRLRTAEPALETARRRIRELEDAYEDEAAEATRARQRKETHLREVAQCRERMRGLRRRHGRLTEKAQSFEKRLFRSSGCFGGTALFAAAAAAGPGAGPSPRHTSAPAVRSLSCAAVQRPAPRTPRSTTGIAAAGLTPVPQPMPAPVPTPMPMQMSRSPEQDTPSVGGSEGMGTESLGYLRHLIELEELRLGTRVPPQPCPTPGIAPVRSEVALAALGAGASPAHAVSLLDGGVPASSRTAPYGPFGGEPHCMRSAPQLSCVA